MADKSTLQIRLELKDRATKELERSGASIRKFSDQAAASLQRVSDTAGRLGRRVTLLGGIFAGLSVRTFASFERTFLTIQGVLRQTAQELDPLRSQILELGASTEFTARQVASAAETFARAGLSQQEILQALPSTIDAATAAGIDLQQSAEIVTSTIKGQNRSFEDATKILDVFTSASSAANVRIEELGQNFPTLAANATQLGFSFEEVTAVMSLLVDRGLEAGEVATGLNNILIRLGGNRAAQKQLKALGVDVTDASGELLSLTDQVRLFEQRAASAGSNLESFSEIAQIFGVRGRLFNTLVSVGSDRLQEFQDNLKRVNGRTAEFSGLVRSGLQGGIDQLISAFEGLQVAFVEALLPQITAFLERTTQVIRIIQNLNPEVLALAGTITAVVGVGGILVGIVGSLVAAFIAGLPVILAVGGAIAALAVSADLAVRGLRAVGAISKDTVAPSEALEGVIRDIKSAFRDAREAAMGFKEQVEQDISGQKIDKIAEAAETARQRFLEADGATSRLNDSSRLSKLEDAMNNLDPAVGAVVAQMITGEEAGKRFIRVLEDAANVPEIGLGGLFGPGFERPEIKIPLQIVPPNLAGIRGVVEDTTQIVENEFAKFIDSAGFSLDTVDKGVRELMSTLEQGVFGPDAERLTGQQAQAIRDILARELDLDEILGVDSVALELEELRRRIAVLREAGVIDLEKLDRARANMQEIALAANGITDAAGEAEERFQKLIMALRTGGLEGVTLTAKGVRAVRREIEAIILEQEGVTLGFVDIETQILRLETALQTGFLRGIELSGEAILAVKRRVEELRAAIPPDPEDFWGGFIEGARQASGAMDTLRATGQRLGAELSSALSSNLGDFFFDLGSNINDADQAWREFASSVIRDLGRIAAQQAALAIVGTAFGALPGGSTLFGDGGIAKGGFTPIRAFADGGVVTRPTIGLVGERGDDEAVVPLRGGAIPVVGNTGGGANVTINISATDPRGVKELLLGERRTIVGILQEAMRTDSDVRRDIGGAGRNR